jgi:hypothetical protein
MARQAISRRREETRKRPCGRRATLRRKGIEMRKCYHGLETAFRWLGEGAISASVMAWLSSSRLARVEQVKRGKPTIEAHH